MAKYESGDMVTYYFIVRNDSYKTIKAWTDKKKLAEFYMKFHNCNLFTMKEVTATIDEIAKILEENYNDEIMIANLYTKDTNREGKVIIVPATTNELNLVREEAMQFFSGRIDYNTIYTAYHYLKKKYQEALDRIFLNSVVKHVIHNKTDTFIHSIDLDLLKLLLKSFPSDFD